MKRKVYILGVLTLVLSMFAFNTQLFAQQQEPNEQSEANEPADFFEMSLEELMEVPVVVSASRQEQKIAAGNGELMFGVTDVLKKEAEPAWPLSATSAHETPGRTFFVRLQYKF